MSFEPHLSNTGGVGVNGGIAAWSFAYASFTVPTNMSQVTLRMIHDLVYNAADHGYIDQVAITPIGQFSPPVPVPSQPAQLSVQMIPGLWVQGSVERTYGIEFCTSLQSSNWIPLVDITLPYSPYLFADLTATNSTSRFYRAIAK